ncbi:MAG: SIR2 family protein [Neisseriaceae bacterium]|nr:SIR2 family protein [Neisseriaceae bacterium]
MSGITFYKGSEEPEKLSIEKLKNEMAKYLQVDNLSFLLGAGCSSNIVDKKETGISGMAGLYQKFFEKNPNFQVANQSAKDKFDNNLEKMLEAMGAVQIVNQLNNKDDKIEEKMSIVQNFLREEIKLGLDSKEVKEIYKNFYSKITQRSRKSPISIFTTNYDLFNEMALDELGFPYNNGFSGTYRRKFNPVSYYYKYVENMNLQKDTWEPVTSFFNLIKLHGSISWVRENDWIWEQDFKTITDDKTVMIYPTPLKDRSTLMTPYSDLFRVMENRIVQNNSVLIVLGYSFSDDHINRVILNGLSIPSFRLVVFGWSDNIEKLTKLKDSRISVIYSEDKDKKIHYFKNFVDNVLPKEHPDIEESTQQRPVNELITKFEQGNNNEQS